jgi:hypothetical protein
MPIVTKEDIQKIRNRTNLHMLNDISDAFRNGCKLPHTMEMLSVLADSVEDTNADALLVVSGFELLYFGYGKTQGLKAKTHPVIATGVESILANINDDISKERIICAADGFYHIERYFLQKQLEQPFDPDYKRNTHLMLTRLYTRLVKDMFGVGINVKINQRTGLPGYN